MNILSGAKLALYGIFLNYYCYYVLTGHFIPGGTILFLGFACLCVGLDILGRRNVYIGTEIRCWMLYAVLALITTLLITVDSSDMDFVRDIAKYVQRLLLIMMTAYICEREKSVRFGLRLMAVTAFASAVSILIMLEDVRSKLNITSEANLSANDIGAIMAFGCFAILYAWGRRNRSSLVLSGVKLAGVLCCISVIFLAGSRKSIFAVAVMLMLYILLCLPDSSRYLNLWKFLIGIVIILAAYVIIDTYLIQYVEETNLYRRLFGAAAEGAAQSDEIRVQLYKWALEDFLQHPLFGVGFNQYAELHGNYTHSTYVEPLACSGMIGFLYLYPYYSMVKKQIQLILRNPKGSLGRLKQKEIFVYLCMFLFVGVGIPYMYKDTPCILLGTFIASQAISFEELRADGGSSAEY